MSRSQFPLFQTPIDLAHSYWKSLLRSDDCVIDATCGNGHDTLELARLVPHGRIIALDIQNKAIEATRQRIYTHLPQESHKNISFYQQCHSTFPKELEAKSVALIAYNLGYLPGENKQMTTMRPTTLLSLQEAVSLIQPGGAISVMCYPGHPEGKFEEEAVINFGKTLEQQEWSSCHHRWVNRNSAPSLLILQRANQAYTERDSKVGISIPGDFRAARNAKF